MTVRMILVVALGLLAACGPPGPEKKPAATLPEPWSDAPPRQIADCGDLFRFDPDGTLSPEEYFRLTTPDQQTAGGGEGRLSYRAFDYEDTISRDGWMALGVVNARAKPGDAKSIGGLLWVKDSAALLSGGGDSLTREGDKLKLSVEVGEVSSPEGAGKCAQPYLVTLDDRGVLTAGGREVGRVQ
ncbi:hypothetical protein [Phenylobacterium sp. 58.2.17]|uniref:hypothetical protein n=1 Tax=Phenylobacterium sp. 58.2.17 TaxID=2969306 RepID=UPI002263FF87|nr:hypothetical protein [Phenylobacterium sp. 58.2.17]MCX7587174.1 hypothetical protein [Phenylobacterium sp. 58.2.17]